MSYKDLRDKAFTIKKAWVALGSQETMDHKQAAVKFSFVHFW